MAPKTSLISKFPCFLKLPPTDLERPASFFAFFLLSVYRGQFVNQQGSKESHGDGWGRGQAKPCLISANQRWVLGWLELEGMGSARVLLAFCLRREGSCRLGWG